MLHQELLEMDLLTPAAGEGAEAPAAKPVAGDGDELGIIGQIGFTLFVFCVVTGMCLTAWDIFHPKPKPAGPWPGGAIIRHINRK